MRLHTSILSLIALSNAMLISAKLVWIGSSSGGQASDTPQLNIYGVNGNRWGLTFDARPDGSFLLVDTAVSTDKEGTNWGAGNGSFRFGSANVRSSTYKPEH